MERGRDGEAGISNYIHRNITDFVYFYMPLVRWTSTHHNIFISHLVTLLRAGAVGAESRGSAHRRGSANGLTQQKSWSQLRVSAKHNASCLSTKTYAHSRTRLKHGPGTLAALYSNLIQSFWHSSMPHTQCALFPANTTLTRDGTGQSWEPIRGLQQLGITRHRFFFYKPRRPTHIIKGGRIRTFLIWTI